MLEYITKTAIDAVHSAKKTAIDTFVKHEDLANTLNSMVDAQTEYTKKAVETAFVAGSQLVSTFSEKAFYTDAVKAYAEEAKSWVPAFNKKEK